MIAVAKFRFKPFNFIQVRNLHVASCYGLQNTSSIKQQRAAATPRRAIMYVPGYDDRKANKAATLTIDSIVLDCEDGVALNKKVG